MACRPETGASMFDSRFLEWPQAPDSRKRDMWPRREETPFASPGPQARENLACLRELTPHRHEKTSHKVSKKMPKMEPKNKTKTPLQLLFFKLDFEVPF